MTSRSQPFLRSAVAALGVASAAACSGTSSDPGSVEIYTWWSERGETDAMEVLRDMFLQQHPGDKLLDRTAGDSDAARKTLRERMIAGVPPDTFQANGGRDLLR